jgi:formiminotetrahydrofolate cyclodeaminase
METLLLIINNLELCSESAIDEDGEDFEELMKAWKLPSNTEEEKLIRQKEIEKASRKAAEVPRAVAEASLKILDYSKIIAKKGNKKLISDVLCGAVFAHSSLIASIYNVKINLKSIKDEDYIKKMLSKFENMEQKADEFLKEIREIVDKTL